MIYTPERGDIVWLHFSPHVGHEQAGRRPTCVLSPSSYNVRVGLAVFCPITNQAKGYPFEVQIPNDLEVSGVVLSDQVKSLDWRARKAVFICKLSNETITEVMQKLAILIG